MNNALSVKPGKPVSLVSLIVTVFLVFFGIGFAVIVGTVLVDNEAPTAVIIVFGIFMTGWLIAAISMVVYHFLNLKRSKGMPLFDIEIPSDLSDGKVPRDPAGTLRDLEGLRKDGLVSQEEYELKRAQIMAERW